MESAAASPPFAMASQDSHDEDDVQNDRTSTSSASSLLQSPGSSAEFDLFVEDLLEQMQSRFDKMGSSILGRIDEMGKRMSVLEQSIGDIMEQAGFQIDPATGLPLLPSTPQKQSTHATTTALPAVATTLPSNEAVEV